MPPKNKERPPEKETKELMTGCGKQCTMPAGQQQTEGRVVLRRLNRNRIRNDPARPARRLVAVKDLLPDDNIAAGFDNVAPCWTSPRHLLRYQTLPRRP